ncbi:LOW QUALITY PROTEIN: hypothetical protein ACHAXR_009026 [Thalassiosira sp. AJA248-18]
MKKKKKKKRTYKPSLSEDQIYDTCAETQKASVKDGQRLTKRHIKTWACPHTSGKMSISLLKISPLPNQSTYILRGCESCTLKESYLDDMDILLHSSNRQILGVKWSQMREEHVTNESISKRFYNIKYPRHEKDDCNKAAPIRWESMRKEDSFIPKQLMTSWVSNNKRPRGRPIATNKTSIVKSLQQLYPPNTYFFISSAHNLLNMKYSWTDLALCNIGLKMLWTRKDGNG